MLGLTAGDLGLPALHVHAAAARHGAGDDRGGDRERAGARAQRLLRPGARADAGRPLRRLAERASPSAGTRSSPARGSPTSAAATRPRSPARVLDEVASATLVDVALAPELARHPKVTGDRGPAARRARRGARSLGGRRALPLGARAPVGARSRAGASSAGCSRRAACALVNVPSWRGKALPGVRGLPARRQPRRGDGRPQALLRPARPLADARRAPASARATSAATATSSRLNTFAVCRVPEAGAMSGFAERYLRETIALVGALDTEAIEAVADRARRAAATAAAACSSSASAARPGTPATRSTTSASSAPSRPTRRPTTSRS